MPSYWRSQRPGAPSATGAGRRCGRRCAASISFLIALVNGAGRKLVARVEATGMGTDVRCIVTSLEGRGKTLYEKVFCARGAAENLIKDMKRFTRSDKTACSRWQANQFRLFLHVGAYWLLHSLRRAAPKRSRWRGATFETIRRTFVKVAVRVEELKGRIKLAYPASYPQAAMLAVMTGTITTRGP